MLSNSNSHSAHNNPLDDHDYCSPRKFAPLAQTSTPPQSNRLAPFSNLTEASNDSVASSSSISSEDSSRGLVIAQDGQKIRSLAPKDTPSVSKPKLGRRPMLKTQFELGKLKKAERPQQQQQARQRRPRQNTSVTDKSQWITGEEEVESALSEHIVNVREKRQRKEVHDPEFSHFTGSEYSSSEASYQESEEEDELDPNRPWCDCNKPDDGDFMIECDICEYWFHGHCVGVTKALNTRWQEEGREWFCSHCDHAVQSGTPREQIPRRIPKKEKKSTTSKLTRKRRGRPRKTESSAREVNTRQSARNAKKSTLDEKSTLFKKSSARVESYREFDNSDRLKELIAERKREYFRKKRFSQQLLKEKIKDMRPARGSVPGSLGNSLELVASSTTSSNLDNLPTNINKSEQKDHSKPNIVLQINTKKASNPESSGQRIVTAVVKKRKQSESNEAGTNELFTADPIQLNKKNKTHIERREMPPSPVSKSKTDHISLSSETKMKSSPQKSESNSKRKRKDSESTTANGSSKHIDSRDIVQKIKDCLELGRKGMKDTDNIPADLAELASKIEKHMQDCFGVGSSKYLAKYRSLIFNMRDPKNQELVKNVLNGEIEPGRLVRMSPEEMASHELAKWRERENKHAIEMIKRESELAAQEVIIKKTHKGEEVIAASSLNDSDELNVSKGDQEAPTSSTKTQPATSEKSTKIKGAQPENEPAKVTKSELPASAPSLIESLAFLDTTANHGNHVYDMNCKICNKQQPETTKSPDIGSIDPNTTATNQDDSTKKANQPKRLRISIQTNLDPADLSRLKEPLIKPLEQPHNQEYSPSRISPASDSVHEDADDDDEDLYDPETSTIPPHSLLNSDKANPDSECWSGTIASSQIAKFDAIAKPVSGNLEFMKSKISKTLSICGRIPPDQVGTYIKKLKLTTKNQILLVQLFPSTDNDKASFNTFCDHLYTRNRCGVIEVGAFQPFLKDFYLLPIHENGHIPDYLKPINGPGLSRKEPNCLLGLLVKHKRPGSASSSSSNNTPTSAK